MVLFTVLDRDNEHSNFQEMLMNSIINCSKGLPTIKKRSPVKIMSATVYIFWH